MKNLKRSTLLSAVTLICSFLLSAQVRASSEAETLERMKNRAAQVVQAKDAGKVGERPDGLLGVVKGDVDAATRKIVDDENSDRQSVYTGRAAQQGQSLDVFMRVMGDSRIDQEKSGRFIQKVDGSWHKKR
ncbi:MAG: DUF1318 domain-containing protein [Bdellovibrionales bacterium]|nr:DUF1318 domain-containing protein [Bdellovibrionales bacterium]